MLSELPNIGKELEQRLGSIGIHNPGDLAELGSIGVLQRLDALSAPGCINMLYALEGAIRGTRWHNLSSEVKENLKTELKSALTEQ